MSIHRVSYLTVSEQYNLNIACRPVSNIGYGTFHVGSSLRTRDFRDVDLRCILPNEEFDGWLKNPDLQLYLNGLLLELDCQLISSFKEQLMQMRNFHRQNILEMELEYEKQCNKE